jgi:hypothetical protein
MNTAIAAIWGRYQQLGPCNMVFQARKRMGVSHERLLFNLAMWWMVTVSAGGVTSRELIAAAALPLLYPIGTAMKATGALAAMVRVRLDGVAVVAAGA